MVSNYPKVLNLEPGRTRGCWAWTVFETGLPGRSPPGRDHASSPRGGPWFRAAQGGCAPETEWTFIHIILSCTTFRAPERSCVTCFCPHMPRLARSQDCTGLRWRKLHQTRLIMSSASSNSGEPHWFLSPRLCSFALLRTFSS
jgi:hypothetical protein